MREILRETPETGAVAYADENSVAVLPDPREETMSLLPIAGLALLALWLVETVLFLIVYRQSKGS